MRSVWIASGLIFALLSLASLLRPSPTGGFGVEESHVPDSHSAEMGHEELSIAAGPRPLAASDLAQILAVKSQIGSAADRLADAGVVRADFERELRQLAGLDEDALAAVDRAKDSKGNVSTQSSRIAACQAILRGAALAVDELADDADVAEDDREAERLRSLAQRVRDLTRISADDRITPEASRAPSGRRTAWESGSDD